MAGSLALVILFLTSAQNPFNQPESIVFDVKHDRYLVSNYGSGEIVQVNTIDDNEAVTTPSPVFEPFNTELSWCLGMHIMNDTLYVSSNLGVVGFDLETAVKVMAIEIPESILLNDIASDPDGFLYVSDRDCHMIFKVDPINLTYTILVESGIHKPNGLLYEQQTDRLHRRVQCSHL